MSLIPNRPPATAEPDNPNALIQARELVRIYGRGKSAVRALDGLSLTAPAGTVLGLLGPNGAGKSTAVRILTTLTRADAGTARVAGFDVAEDPARVRQAVGYIPQKPSIDPTATGKENLQLVGRIHGLSRREAAFRAGELLERFGLDEAADRITRTWSGGMQRKLDVALGLVNRPRVLFLDEPTTGLDPEARADLWREIKSLADEGLTVLLTTHYLDEADHLANQLVIIDQGRVVARGTPDGLKAELARDTIHIELIDPGLLSAAMEIIDRSIQHQGLTAVRATAIRIEVANGAGVLPRTLAALTGAGIGLTAITLARPTLDDVYLRHAGRLFRDADTDAREVA